MKIPYLMQLMFLSFLAPVSAYCDSHHGITDVHTHIIVPEYMEVLRAHGAGTGFQPYRHVEPCRACNRCGMNGQIKGAPKKAAFLMTYADTAAREAEPMLVHYRMLMDYLGWTSVGEVVAPGVWTAGSVRNTDYPQQAYRLGKSL